jgi:hypothetical protein
MWCGTKEQQRDVIGSRRRRANRWPGRHRARGNTRRSRQGGPQNARPAKGSVRPVCKVTPLLNSAHGSKRVDLRGKRIERVFPLLTHGDP